MQPIGGSHPVLHLSANYYRMHAPFNAATQDDNYAGDKHMVFDQHGDVVSSFPTYDTAKWAAEQMNELAAKHLMVHGTRAAGYA